MSACSQQGSIPDSLRLRNLQYIHRFLRCPCLIFHELSDRKNLHLFPPLFYPFLHSLFSANLQSSILIPYEVYHIEDLTFLFLFEILSQPIMIDTILNSLPDRAFHITAMPDHVTHLCDKDTVSLATIRALSCAMHAAMSPYPSLGAGAARMQARSTAKSPPKFCHLFPPQSRIALAIVAALTAAAFIASASAPVTLTFFVTFAS